MRRKRLQIKEKIEQFKNEWMNEEIDENLLR